MATELLIGILSFAAVVLIALFRAVSSQISRNQESIETAAKENRSRCEAVSKELMAFRIEVANNYVTKAYLDERFDHLEKLLKAIQVQGGAA